MDLHGGYGAALAGHAHPAIAQAISEQAGRGTHFAQPTPDAIAVATELARRFGLPRWRFANSGTEATMDAVHLMRSITGRDLIIKIEGCYHGHHDSVQVSVAPDEEDAGPKDKPNSAPSSTGIPKAITDLTLIAVFNDLDSVARLLDEHQGQIAGMIIEPVMMNAGIIKPEPGYLEGLKALLHDHRDALLTFDEVKTGLTVGPGGVTQNENVQPDLITLAKSLGGGVAVAAIGGTAEVMDHVATGGYEMVGTFNGNPLAMAATRAMLTEVATSEAYEKIEKLRQRAASGIRASHHDNGLTAHVVTAGAKGCVVFSAEPVRNYRGLPRRGRQVQPRALALPAQRRGLPAALGQDRAVADLGAARRGGHRPPGRELRRLRPAVNGQQNRGLTPMAHPREGWQGHGVPRKMTRRSFLGGSARAALAALGSAPLLSACASALAGTGTVQLPRPDNPVKWPVFPGNTAIASNLPPEPGATLQIYTWVAYINQACVNAFAKKHKVKVQITTFNTMNEALSKLRSGLSYDLLIGATVDTLGQLIESKLVQPLNHSYIPNITQAWPDFTNPFYDQGWQYTVPYTIYTTGISWRKDLVDENPYTMSNPWAMPWQAKYKGRVAILDDYRESISLGLMKNGIFDLNTTDYRQINTSRQALEDLTNLVNVRIDNNDYTEVPDGDTWIHHAWSGDMAAAESYMPKGVPVTDVGYWFPPDGKGPVANDTNLVLRSATNPVLAHMFLNYMQDLPNVLENISFNGYMQPSNGVTPQVLVKEQILPPSLLSTVVLPSYFRRGVAQLQLPVDADALWQQAWLVVSNGI